MKSKPCSKIPTPFPAFLRVTGKDAENGGRQYAAAQAAEQKRRNRLIGLGAGGGILVIVLIVVLRRVPSMQSEALGDLGLYACIPIGDSQKDYDFAVSILKQLLESAN